MCYELHFVQTILTIIWAYELIKMNNTNKLNLAQDKDIIFPSCENNII